MRQKPEVKPVGWIASSRKDLKDFPETVQDSIGDALQEAQYGRKPIAAKPLAGFHGAGVLEIVDNNDGDTYRAVYTVRFAEIIYVLHAFKKKSRYGIQTSRHDIDLVHARLNAAEKAYQDWRRPQQKEEQQHG